MVKFYQGLADELSLYVRQTAWLDTRQQGDKTGGESRPSRREQYKQAGIDEPDMPPCAAGHVVGYLFEIGPVLFGAMGTVPISHTEIAAWQTNTGIELDAWTARTIRALSHEYLAMTQQAEAPDCPSPWADAPYAQSKARIAGNSLKDSIKGLAEL